MGYTTRTSQKQEKFKEKFAIIKIHRISVFQTMIDSRTALCVEVYIIRLILKYILILLIYLFLATLMLEVAKAEAPEKQLTTEITDPTKDSNSVLVAPISIPKQTGCEQYRKLLSKYDWNVDLMLLIMKGESGCNPEAVGDGHLTFNNGTQGMSCGLLQIRVLDGRPDCDSLKDVEANIEWGYKIYTEQGYRAWTVYRNMR